MAPGHAKYVDLPIQPLRDCVVYRAGSVLIGSCVPTIPNRPPWGDAFGIGTESGRGHNAGAWGVAKRRLEERTGPIVREAVL